MGVLIERTWKRIEKWLAEHAPELLKGFNPPATEREIRKTERFLGVQFPEDGADGGPTVRCST